MTAALRRARPRFIVGVDESGTGAFAGPFTICAFMTRAADTKWVHEEGAKDSKQLSAPKRRALCDALAPCAIIADIVVVPGDYLEQSTAYREGLADAIAHCLSVVADRSEVLVQIDGSGNDHLKRYLRERLGVRIEFVPKGDQLIPQISAASIFAKTVRTACMADLHEQFPMYCWAANDGYGTVEHRAAIELHGICPLHRRIRPLLRYFPDADTGDNGKALSDGGGALRGACHACARPRLSRLSRDR